jgi:hypothetical protein
MFREFTQIIAFDFEERISREGRQNAVSAKNFASAVKVEAWKNEMGGACSAYG